MLWGVCDRLRIYVVEEVGDPRHIYPLGGAEGFNGLCERTMLVVKRFSLNQGIGIRVLVT